MKETNYFPDTQLTTKRIYELAHTRLTELWCREYQKSERFKVEQGRTNEIAEARVNKYWAQLEQLEKLMEETEE